MHSIAHSVFGEVEIHPTDGTYWTKQLSLRSRGVAVDMTVEESALATPEALDRVAPFVTRLADFDSDARRSLRQNYEEGPDSTVAQYKEHHLEELSAEVVAAIFGKPKEAVDVDAFLSATYLRRVGLYPTETDGCAAFDYTIGENATQYLMVVRFNADGEVTSIEMES